MKRIYSIDFTRGLVMIIMALDHVRDLMHIDSVTRSPTNLETTTPFLFFTRWITYLCAPIFVYLAGSSAYLSFNNKNDISESRKFLLSRGLWLVIMEFTIVNFGLFFDLGFHTLIFEVIATIGFGFIILSLMLKLPFKIIAAIGLMIIFCHELAGKTILSPFFVVSQFRLFSNHSLTIAYPPVPWLGIMLTGFASGKLFELPAVSRRKIFLKIGASVLLLFVILRAINIYGDPVLWSGQKTPVYTFLSFMNISKYPPSLLFCLVTLGIMFLILSAAEGVKNRITDMFCIYGKVPMFYFVVHFYIIHFLLLILLFLQGFHWSDMNFASGKFGRPANAESGVPLWTVYLIWIAVVSVLYRPCGWYGRFKATHKNWWLRYL